MNIITFFILTAVNFILFYNLRYYAADDLYIHLRIANHLYSSGSPYFNLQEAINGSSSLLWILILTIFNFLPFDTLMLVSLLNAAVLSAVIFCSYSILGNRFYTFLALVPFYALSFQQMESSLASLFVLLGMRSDLKKNYGGLVYFSLAALTRLEFAVLCPLFFVFKYLKKQSGLVFEIILSFLPVVIYIVYNFYFFGDILPQTLKAKSIVYEINNKIFFEELGFVFSADEHLKYKIFYFIIFLTGLLFSFKYAGRKDQKTAPFIILLGVLIITFVYYIKGIMIFPWYLILITGPAFCSLFYLAKSNQSQVILPITLISLLPFFKVMITNIYSGFFDPAFYSDYFRSARVGQYLNTGKVLNDICPGCSLMAPEIGGLGYTFKGKILDAVGLVTPEALKFHPLPVPHSRYSGSVGAVPGAFVEEVKPDIIVSLEIFLKDFKKHKVCENYKAISVSPFLKKEAENLKRKILWGSDALMLLLRKDKFTDEMILNIKSRVNLNSPDIINAFECK